MQFCIANPSDARRLFRALIKTFTFNKKDVFMHKPSFSIFILFFHDEYTHKNYF